MDQFGGEKNIKFLMQNFRELLLSIHHKTLPEQNEILNQTITAFQGERKQVDDMLVFGVRLA
jgi:serine phosphatase RsbU (regulator of sigma subunit)